MATTTFVAGTYHVFGSGSAWVGYAQRQHSVERLLAFMDRMFAERKDAGDNGFIGIYEAPASLLEEFNVAVTVSFSPGRKGEREPGLKYLPPRRSDLRDALAAGITDTRQL